MTDLFDAAAARDAKVHGMAQSEKSANEEWSHHMVEMVRLTCMEQLLFTADDVFERSEMVPNAPTTHDSRAFGPVMIRAAKKGYCEQTDVTQKSRRASCHHRPLAVWRSKLYRR